MGIEYAPKQDYAVTQCEVPECGQDVWIGPKQQEARLKNKYMVLCVKCVLTAAKQEGIDPKDLEIRRLSNT